MAKVKSTTTTSRTFMSKPKKKKPGVHSKKRHSKSKKSVHYKKRYRGQGR